jgi:hypothetical protein
MPKELRLIVIRPDIANQESASATAYLCFETASDDDVEMSVTWGDTDRNRGTYLIPRSQIDELTAWLDERTE